MKLWIKVSALSLTIVLLTVGTCLAVFVHVQREQTLQMSQSNALERLSSMVINLSSTKAMASERTSDLTRRSVVHYYFTQYAHVMQFSGASYALAQDGAYLYNDSPYDLRALLAATNLDSNPVATVSLQDKSLLIAEAELQLFDMPYTVYTCIDVTNVYASLDRQAQFAWLLLLASALCTGLLLPLLVRRALANIPMLKTAAEKIAGGDYTLRTNISSRDEIGALSTSFDRMTEAVKAQFDALSDVATRRKLLLGALTHELKTPMTAIIGYADSLLHLPLDDEKKQLCAAQIAVAAKRTELLQQKLMALLSLDKDSGFTPDMKLCDTQSFIGDLTALFPHINVQCQADTLYGDRELLFSLVQNLIDNAYKASSDDGQMSLQIEQDDAGTHIRVLDRGCGIAAEHIALITEPFYLVDKARSRKSGGIGLGLALCQMICTVHHGTIDVTSTLHAGTCIHVTLPRNMI